MFTKYETTTDLLTATGDEFTSALSNQDTSRFNGFILVHETREIWAMASAIDERIDRNHVGIKRIVGNSGLVHFNAFYLKWYIPELVNSVVTFFVENFILSVTNTIELTSSYMPIIEFNRVNALPLSEQQTYKPETTVLVDANTDLQSVIADNIKMVILTNEFGARIYTGCDIQLRSAGYKKVTYTYSLK